MWMIVEVKVNFKFLRSIEDRSIMKMRCVHVYVTARFKTFDPL